MMRAGDQIGPYTLVSKLGRGAFGVVWLAERRTAIATTKAALKMPLDDEIDLEVVKQEANVWIQASGHPNVLPIIEANIYDEQIVIASEYAPDGSLENWLQNHGGLAPSIDVAIEMMSGILSGLEHLHTRKIIHRDLKPANLLLQGQTPRLTDFGISRMLKSTSISSIIAGTPAYMAPEAFDGKRNVQTDVWSAGVIFYQLLAGRLPFPQTDFTGLVGAILTRVPDELPASVPMRIKEVISLALQKDVARRYKSAIEMRNVLRRFTQTPIESFDQATMKRPLSNSGNQDQRTHLSLQETEIAGTVRIQTNKGDITILLYPDEAPATVANFVDLVERGFYDGLKFHRYEPGFIIQGGDPLGNGKGGYVDPQTGRERRINLEVTPKLKHGEAGAVAMARSSNLNSASSQFYITLGPASFLDMQYAVFGRVINGMDVVKQIRAGDTMIRVKVID